MKTLAIFIVALMVLPIAAALVSSAGYVNTIVFQRIEDDQAAVGSLLFGNSQGRLFRLRSIDLVNRLQEAGFQTIKAASGLTNILVNPTDTCQDGSINIFQNQKARFALQFLVPRGEIVSQIYEGYAIPVILPWTPLDPDYPYLVGTALKWQAIIDAKGEQYGVQLLQQALQELGATQGADGKWYWSNGDPVTVKFVIRLEDQRKDIGDLLANKLENDVGITVERLYNDFAAAFQIVYSGDPSACEWQLYTEGWGITGMTQYDYGNFVWFYSSIWGAMPGWLEPTYWNYHNTTIDEIAQKLDNGDYANETEFWQLLNEGVDLGIQESVRVFIASTYDFYAVSGDLQGVLPSPKASPWHTFTFMNLQYPEDTVTLTNRYVYASGWAWNPVGGFQDFYSRPVVEAITWPGITSRITDGKTGWSPANTVEWSLERGPVTVDSDAVLYDHAAHQFVTAAEANVTTAKNAVTINYKLLGQIKFHDGTTETEADLLAPLYIIFEYAYDDSTNTTVDNRFEGPIAGDYYTFLNSIVAVKVINETTVKVYVNYDHLDPGFIAGVASIWTSYPLELYAAMDLLWQYGQPDIQNVPENVTPKYVWSLDASDEYHPAIHLLDTYQGQQMVDLLQQYKTTPPDWVQQLINLGFLTQAEWEQRVDNLINFFNQHNHMVVANGPFYLDSYDAQNDIATVKRVTDFPVDPATVAAELQPKSVDLQINYDPVNYNTEGTALVTLSVSVNGQPATNEDVKIYAVAVNLETFASTFLTINYQEPGSFEAVLPTNVSEGSYQIVILAYPVGYSNPAQQSVSVTLVTPQPGTTTTTSEQPPETTTTTTPPPEQTTTTTSGAPEEGGVSGTVIAAVVVVIIIIAAAYYFMRK
ncbi:MAG: ABC transporter substrate-binding protein [Desulfurococcales archaeon]|nr:ABC transporter substrate-binding protein [Desulfurococcales archaeon]